MMSLRTLASFRQASTCEIPKGDKMDGTSLTPEQIEFAGLQRVSYAKLPWEEKLTIMWGWLWRNMLVSFATGAAFGIAATVMIGILRAVAGTLDPSILSIMLLVLLIPLSVASVHPLIGWILSSRIGDYRIILCKRRDTDDITISEPRERKIVAF